MSAYAPPHLPPDVPPVAVPRPTVAGQAGAVIVALGALAGCAPALVQLPAPAPGARREAVLPRGAGCRGDRCTARVGVGERRLVVTTRTRPVPAEAAAGRPARSMAARAAGAVGNAVLRRLGSTTAGLYVVQGTRAVADPGAGAAGLRLACTVVAVSRERQTRDGDSTRSALAPLASGLACGTTGRTTAGPAGSGSAGATDDGPRWRVRQGVATDGPALAAVLDTAEAIAARTPDDDAADRATREAAAGAPLTLERVSAVGGDVTRYTVEPIGDAREPGGGRRRWLVRRPDGHAVGALVFRLGALAALDVHAEASAEEAAVLRLLSACLAEPIE